MRLQPVHARPQAGALCSAERLPLQSLCRQPAMLAAATASKLSLGLIEGVGTGVGAGSLRAALPAPIGGCSGRCASEMLNSPYTRGALQGLAGRGWPQQARRSGGRRRMRSGRLPHGPMSLTLGLTEPGVHVGGWRGLFTGRPRHRRWVGRRTSVCCGLRARTRCN